MYRLLIADSTEIFVDALCDALHSHYELTSCTDGTQVPELVRIFQPDILLLDLQMPGMDGLSILENIRDAGYKPIIIATARLMTDYVQNSLVPLGVIYAIMKPCNIRCVIRRIDDAAEQLLKAPVGAKNKKEIVERMLLALGFRPSLIGFRCVLEAVMLIMDNPDLAITKQVYPRVAEICGSTQQQVEHAIRLAVADAWKHHDEAIWAAYFPKNAEGTVRRPTNAVLLTYLAACVRTRTSI